MKFLIIRLFFLWDRMRRNVRVSSVGLIIMDTMMKMDRIFTYFMIILDIGMKCLKLLVKEVLDKLLKFMIIRLIYI